MEEERASFLLRTLSTQKSGGAAGSNKSQYSRITRLVTDSPFYTKGTKTLSFLWRWGGTISWVLSTSLVVLIFPLWLEIGRELDMGQLETTIMEAYQAKGYPPQQLQIMQQQGQFGIPPMPPPSQPMFE